MNALQRVKQLGKGTSPALSIVGAACVPLHIHDGDHGEDGGIGRGASAGIRQHASEPAPPIVLCRQGRDPEGGAHVFGYVAPAAAVSRLLPTVAHVVRVLRDDAEDRGVCIRHRQALRLHLDHGKGNTPSASSPTTAHSQDRDY